MAFTQTKTFNINESSTTLEKGDKLIFKYVLKGSTTSNFTASITQGSLYVASLAVSTGYASTDCPYFDSASISSSIASGNTNIITLDAGITSFYNNNYQFVPNPLTGSLNSLYDEYGDVDYPFSIKTYDIALTYLSDGTYVESRILSTSLSPSNLLQLHLDTPISNFYADNLISGSFQRFLILSRIEDETNTHLIFKKREGITSYGFIIPQNIAPDVLANIDTITREAKQKLFSDQSIINNINGGGF
jgi:cold shock CspA family protein